MILDDGFLKRAREAPEGMAAGESEVPAPRGKSSKPSSPGERSSRRRRSSSGGQEPGRALTTPAPALRTATRRNQQTKPTQKKGETQQKQRARTSHNLVEKEYRSRLHGYFEALLAVLPPELHETHKVDDDRGAGGRGASTSSSPTTGQHKKLSKAEVLERARHHIESLEKDNGRQKQELSELRVALEQMEQTTMERWEERQGQNSTYDR